MTRWARRSLSCSPTRAWREREVVQKIVCEVHAVRSADGPAAVVIRQLQPVASGSSRAGYADIGITCLGILPASVPGLIGVKRPKSSCTVPQLMAW